MAKAKSSTTASTATPSAAFNILDDMEDDILTARDLLAAIAGMTDGPGDRTSEDARTINRLAHLASDRIEIAAAKRTAAYKAAFGGEAN